MHIFFVNSTLYLPLQHVCCWNQTLRQIFTALFLLNSWLNALIHSEAWLLNNDASELKLFEDVSPRILITFIHWWLLLRRRWFSLLHVTLTLPHRCVFAPFRAPLRTTPFYLISKTFLLVVHLHIAFILCSADSTAQDQATDASRAPSVRTVKLITSSLLVHCPIFRLMGNNDILISILIRRAASVPSYRIK